MFRSDPLSDRHGAEVFIKAEHLQRTGSFKVRGSANVIHSLDASVADAGVVAASSGNHGIGVATAARSRGIPAMIFLPSNASPAKVDQIGRLGANVVRVDGTNAFLAEVAARQHVEKTGLVYISPYNDSAVAAGQGTIGKEILDDVAKNGRTLDALVVSVGGGGLISGIASWAKAVSPATRIIGASARNDRAMAASVAAGQIITPSVEPTFSDGTAGGIEDDSITFPMCASLVDEWIDVTEHEIACAVASMVNDHHQLVEGAAGVAIAAATQHAAANPGSSIVAVSCGANVSAASLRQMLIEANA